MGIDTAGRIVLRPSTVCPSNCGRTTGCKMCNPLFPPYTTEPLKKEHSLEQLDEIDRSVIFDKNL